MVLPFHFDENKLLVLLYSVLIFLIDLSIPYGYSVGMMYMVGILFVRIATRDFLTFLTVLVNVLIVGKLFVNNDYSNPVIINRLFTVIIVSLTAYFKYRNFRLFISKRRAQAKSDIKSRNYDSLIENMMEGAQLISEDWRYVFVNQSILEQVNLSSDQLIGKTMMEVFPGIEKTEMFRKLQEVRKNGKPMHFVNEFTFNDGKSEFFELHVQKISDKLFILSMKITDRVRIEKERVKYTNNLENMLFHTSHKIRQPVANILGLASELKSNDHMNTDEQLSIDYIKRSALKLEVFTKELNDLIISSKIKPPESKI